MLLDGKSESIGVVVSIVRTRAVDSPADPAISGVHVSVDAKTGSPHAMLDGAPLRFRDQP